MPPAVVAVAAGVKAAVTVVSTIGVLGAVAVGAITAIGVNSMLEGLIPDIPDYDMGDARGMTVNTANPAKNIPVIYGRRRVSGNRVFAEVTDGKVVNTAPFFTNLGIFKLALNTLLVDAEEEIRRNQLLHLVYTISEGEVSEMRDLKFNDILSTSSRFKNIHAVKGHPGTDDQVADPDLVAAIRGWTSAHRLRGTAYIYVILKKSDRFRGIPNITVEVDGVKVYDPRDAQTKHSSNPALCIRDYLTNSRYGRGIDSSLIDDTSFIAAANYCDEEVVINGQTLNRYTLNGVVDTSRGVLDNLRAMLTSCRGMLVFSGGKHKLIIDKPESSVFTFNEDNMIGGWSIQLGDKTNIYNRVKASFFNPRRNWQRDAAIVDSPSLRTDDNGLLLEREISLPFTIYANSAKMIAAINMKQSRQMITASFLSTVEGVRCEVGDVVSITHTTPGWTNKLFRVMSLAIQNNDEVRVSVREYDANVYDWGTLDDEDTTPDTNLPNPIDISAPTGLAVSESLYSSREGAGVKVKLALSCDEHENYLVDTYRFEYQPSGGAWTLISEGPYNTAELLDVSPGEYTFRVQARNRFVGGDYSTLVQSVFGLTAVPAAMSNVRLAAISSLAYIQWDQHADIDVRIGGRIEVRHSRKLTGATWAESVWIGEAVDGISTSATYPLKSGTYLVRAVDSTGHVGPVSTVSTPGIQLLSWAATTQLAAHPNFSGTHSNTVHVDGVLKLTGDTLMDSWGLVDDVTDWDSGDGQVNQSGTYTFASGIDQGSVKVCRLETDISVLLVNTQNRMDDWVDVDGLEDWDGTGAALGDVKIEVRTTDDDPAGSPTWSSWENLIIGDYKNRAFEFRAQLTTTDPTYNTHVDQITITANEA